MKPIPLLGAGVTSYSAVVTRQRRLNVMYDIRKDQDRGAVIAVGTPGSTAWITLPTYPIRGWRVIGTLLYVVAGQTLYTVNSGGTYTALGILPTVNSYVSMADDSVTLDIVDGVAGYSVTLATGVITAIADSNFPNGCRSIAVLNSKMVAPVADASRQFRVSQLLAGGTWTPQVFATKENYSDPLLAVDALNGVLILWGSSTFEQWQDTGAYPQPFTRVQGATQLWGLAALYSRVEVSDSIIFLGQSVDGGVKVMRLKGGVATPISDSDIEYIISNLSATADAIGLSYTAYGHVVYQLTFPTAGRTLAYDISTGIWHDAQTGADVQARHFANLGIAFNGKNYFADSITGKIYLVDEDVYTDDSSAIIPREICTRHVRADGNEIFIDRLFLDFETGVGNSSAPDPKVMLSVSRDGGRTFGPEKQRSLGAVGAYTRRVTFNCLGSGYDIVFKIRVTDPVKFVLCGGSAVPEVVDE